MAQILPLKIDLTSGVVAQMQSADSITPASLGTGTPSASKFLRGDGVWSNTISGPFVANGPVTLGSGGVDNLTINCGNIFWDFPTHTSGHTFSGAVAFNSDVTIGNAGGDALTIAPNAVTWSNNPTHSGNHSFSGGVGIGGARTNFTFEVRGGTDKNSAGPSTGGGLFSTDATAPFGLVYAIAGNASNSARVFHLQTQEVGVGNGGILAVQNFSGDVQIGNSGGTVTVNSVSVNLAGSSTRIKGEFGGADSTSALFQHHTTNANTLIGTVPNGTSVISGYIFMGGSDIANSPFGQIYVSGSAVVIDSTKLGSGTTKPLRLQIGSVTKFEIETSGQISVSSTSVDFAGSGTRIKGDFSNATVANRTMFTDRAADSFPIVSFIPSGTGAGSGCIWYGVSDPANTHLGSIYVNPSVVAFSSEFAGTGTQKPLELQIQGTQKLQIGTGGQVAVAGQTASTTTALNTPASTTGVSSLRIPHGSAPSSPVNGDVWTTTAGLFVRINGVTVGPLS